MIDTSPRSAALRLLLRRGADVNIKTNAGETALQEVAAQGDEETVELLLKHNADVCVKAESGDTALHWAARYGSPETVRLLLQSGADATAWTEAGETPGQWANHNRKNDEVKDLLPEIDEPLRVSGKKQPPALKGSIWAVLIGIDDYSHGSDSMSQAMSLKSCVNDARLVEQYLRDFKGVQPSHIKKLLTGSQPGGDSIAPTHGNIIEALESTTDAGAPGDLVYIHHSGHGGVSKTNYPSLKGRRRMDGFLVPQDYQCGGDFLRDIELDYFLRKMVRKGLAVTAVLDCDLHHFMSSLPSSRVGLQGDYQSDSHMSSKTLGFFDGEEAHNQRRSPLVEPKGYTVFWIPSSYEVKQHEKFHGVMTYCLVRLLQDASLEGSSCRGIYRRLRAEIWKEMPTITVRLSGKPNRHFFGNEIASAKGARPMKSEHSIEDWGRENSEAKS